MATWLAGSFKSEVSLDWQPGENICEGGAVQHAKLRSIGEAVYVCHS